jgi:hypothetical protein
LEFNQLKNLPLGNFNCWAENLQKSACGLGQMDYVFVALENGRSVFPV